MLEHKVKRDPINPTKKNPEYEYKIKVLFYKNKETWNTLQFSSKNKYPKKVSWTIAFDGKNLGTILSTNDSKPLEYFLFYARDKFHLPVANQSIPKIGKLTFEFSGWLSGYPNGETLRPLVLVSENSYKDPQNWKPFKPNLEIIIILLPKLKESVRLVTVDYYTNAKTPYDARAKDIKILKSYKNLSGSKLIQLQVDVPNIDCDGQPEAECLPLWFHLSNKGQSKYIGKGKKLIDAGDYDNDGKSEVVFWHSGYNLDGYIMYYDNFNKSVEYFWKYH